MSRRPSPVVIGTFVAGAVGLIVVATLVFGSGRLFRRTYPFVSYFQGSLNGLRVGAPVKFRGVKIGEVSDIRLHLYESEDDPRLAVLFELDETRIRKRGGILHLEKSDQRMNAIANGLRAQLQTESIVTGVLFVGLDMLPEYPPVFAQAPDAPLPEIPTVPTSFEQAQQQLAEIVGQIRKADIEGLVTSIRDAAKEVQRLAASPRIDDTLVSVHETLDRVRRLAGTLDREVGPVQRDVAAAVTDLRRSLASVDATLAQVRTFLAPDAPLPVGLQQTIGDVGEAARALRVLADTLERHPNAIVFGKPE